MKNTYQKLKSEIVKICPELVITVKYRSFGNQYFYAPISLHYVLKTIRKKTHRQFSVGLFGYFIEYKSQNKENQIWQCIEDAKWYFSVEDNLESQLKRSPRLGRFLEDIIL